MAKNRIEGRSEAFEDVLDAIIQINKAAVDGLGEDSFYCGRASRSALVSVCDGSGGMGSRKYERMSGHTGAYMASRVVSGAIRDWYHDNCKGNWKNAEQLAVSINSYISRAFAVCEPYAAETVNIRGSLMRRLPTTLALAYAEPSDEGILVNLIWAGDSRVYLLDDQGLAQLTKDDTYVSDALESLTNDSPMTNVVAADGKYKLNTASMILKGPANIFACTDGCFGYIRSPMDFEHTILDALIRTDTPEGFRTELAKRFAECAGDDFTLSLMSLGYGSYDATQRAFKKRLKYLEDNYIIDDDPDDYYDRVKMLWQNYRTGYERKLNRE